MYRSKRCEMRTVLLTVLFAILTVAAAAQKMLSEDDALLKPSDPAYEDAVKFARVLDQAGVHVAKIFASKLNGFFRDVPRAAYYRTDKGVVEAIFFTDDGAAKIKVTETRDGARYIYSFTGQPHPNPPGDVFQSAGPMYFIAYGNAYVVIMGNKELFETLDAGLKKD
jgi:hypothetical protein